MRNQPKICHVISGYFRNDARVFYRQCLSLKSNDFNVCILTNDAEPNEMLEGVEVTSCTLVPIARWKTLLFAKRYFFNHAIEIDADVYQLHSPELLPLGVKLKKLGKKVVYDAHEDMRVHILEKEWLPKWSRKIASWFFNLYMNHAFKFMDEIISPHSHVVSDLVKRFGKGVLIANFPIIKKRYVTNESDFLARENVFCYSGTVYAYSNQLTIATAMTSAPDALYRLAGYIDDELHGKLIHSRAGDRIEFLGRLSQADLAQFYQKSIAGFAIYDYKLNLGNRLGSYGTNKIFEYMEAGLPIVCTDYELWKDIVERYHCGICVEPGDVKALTQAMLTIMNDRKSAFVMGKNGRRAVENEFNWLSEEIKYCAIFRRLTIE